MRNWKGHNVCLLNFLNWTIKSFIWGKKVIEMKTNSKKSITMYYHKYVPGLLTLSLNTNTRNVPRALWYLLQLQTLFQKLTKLKPKSELLSGLILSTEDETRLLSAHIRRVQPTRCDVSQFIYFCQTLYMFQTVFPSIIRSSKLHIQRQVFVRPLLLPAASLDGQQQVAVLVWQIPNTVRAVLSSWWWTENPSETCRASYRNK